jgi:acetyltransferase-like isoleucine patch superfamily enzyme
MNNILNNIVFHLKRIPQYFLNHPKMIIDFLYLKAHGVETRYSYVVLKGFPIINKFKGSRIILGKGCTLVSKSKYNFAGINHPVILATLSSKAIIKIGKVGISGSSICAAKEITIDDNSGLGANSNIYDTDFHSIDPIIRRNQTDIFEAKADEVRIGKDVWIASNVTILKGVKIGDQAIVGANSLVTISVPANTIYAGNPAKKIKELDGN